MRVCAKLNTPTHRMQRVWLWGVSPLMQQPRRQLVCSVAAGSEPLSGAGVTSLGKVAIGRFLQERPFPRSAIFPLIDLDLAPLTPCGALFGLAPCAPSSRLHLRRVANAVANCGSSGLSRLTILLENKSKYLSAHAVAGNNSSSSMRIRTRHQLRHRGNNLCVIVLRAVNSC